MDLSDRSNVSDGFESRLEADAAVAEATGREDLRGVVVAMRYLYICGIAAWYCASSAKSVAVGPEGR